MAYNVILTDGSGNIVIPLKQVSTNLVSIPLVGREHSGYGQAIATAQIHMLENFANTTSPTNPLTGQLWYDKSEDKLKVYDSTTSPNWRSLASTLNDLTDVNTPTPTLNHVLRYDGSQWISSAESAGGVSSYTQLNDTPSSALQANSFLRVNSLGDEISYISSIPADTISGTLADARIPSNIVRDTVQIITGDGLSGTGDLSGDVTLSVNTGDGISIVSDSVAVDATVVRTTRTITAADGLNGTGNLSNDITLTVDGTVVRTSGNQSIGGTKTFTSTPIAPALTIGSQANKATIQYTANTARTYTIPFVSSSSFVMTEGNQTLSGFKVFDDEVQITSGATLTLNGTFNVNPVANGQLFIGQSSGSTMVKSTLTEGFGIDITNGAGSITIATPNTFDAVGTYAWLFIRNAGVIEGNTYAGSQLFPAGHAIGGTTGVDVTVSDRIFSYRGGTSVSASGTWRAMCRSNPSSGGGFGTADRWGLFLRIA